MEGLLVDRKDLVKNKMTRLLDIAGPPPSTKSTKDQIGIVFVVSKNTFDELLKIDKKMEFMNSQTFIDNIEGTYYVVYNNKKRICEIRKLIQNPQHITAVVDSTSRFLPKDVTVWTGVIQSDDKNTIDNYINKGFNNPYICDKSPLGFKFSYSGFAFIRKNTDKIDKIDKKSVQNKITYGKQQYGKNNCKIHARFTQKTLDYLKNLNNNSAHKELAGSLVVNKVVNEKGKDIFELSEDPRSVKSGIGEEVDAVWSRYNFHTHPKNAYINHGVKKGWPSSQDYVGFIELDNHTIFHTVVTLEGIYIISFSPKWKGNVKDIDRKYVLKHFDVDHRDKETFKEYVDLINRTTYKGSPLFVVKYMPWDKASKTFSVYYNKTGNSCLATDKTFDIHVDKK